MANGLDAADKSGGTLGSFFAFLSRNPPFRWKWRSWLCRAPSQLRSSVLPSLTFFDLGVYSKRLPGFLDLGVYSKKSCWDFLAWVLATKKLLGLSFVAKKVGLSKWRSHQEGEMDEKRPESHVFAPLRFAAFRQTGETCHELSAAGFFAAVAAAVAVAAVAAADSSLP